MSAPCLKNPLQALYRIFVLPTLPPSTPTRAAILSSRPARNTRQFSRSSPAHTKTRPPERRSQKWDEEITARRVYLVDATTGRLSEEPYRTRDLLAQLDPKTQRLVQVTRDDEHSNSSSSSGGGGGGGDNNGGVGWSGEREPGVPVCKLVLKTEIYQSAKRRKEAAKEARKSKTGKDAMKTLELNWAIDMNDLGHRLQRAKEFLEEGRRVEVVLAAKKQGRKASRDECEMVLAKIRELIESIPGAKEKSGFEGVIGGLVKWTLIGSPPSGASSNETSRQEEDAA